MPSGVWLFSMMAATIRGRARAEPLSVYLLVGATAVAAVQPIGLIALEVRYRRNLEPALLGSAPYLEVVADRRGEAHVATAQAEDVVGQL